MKRYEKYKPSGIEWISEVPEHWCIRRIKRVTSIIRGGSPRPIDQYLTENEGYNWIKIGDSVKGSKYITSTAQKIKKEGLKSTRMVHVDDLILSNSMSFGQPYILKIDGCIHDGWLSFSNYVGINKDFLYYILQSEMCDIQFEMSVDGGVVKNLNIDKVGDAIILVPEIFEQEAIAAYLDSRCGDIDKVVATQEKRIALLNEMKQSIITQAVTQGLNPDAKMKNSGVEWIGMVPEHWEVKKLKFVVTCNDDVLDEKTPKDTVIRYVEISDVDSVNGVKNFTEYEFKNAPSRARRITKVDDVIVSTVRTYLKAIARIKDDDLIVSTGFAVLRAKDIDVDYLAYCSLSQYFIDDVISESVGVSYPAINASQLVNIKIALPGINEQKEIADYLNQRCAEIDKQIGTMTRQIELLREYKQSLITEVVTGKRKVC